MDIPVLQVHQRKDTSVRPQTVVFEDYMGHGIMQQASGIVCMQLEGVWAS